MVGTHTSLPADPAGIIGGVFRLSKRKVTGIGNELVQSGCSGWKERRIILAGAGTITHTICMDTAVYARAG
jgi:hypothetical protein